jgi:hypothetical protein
MEYTCGIDHRSIVVAITLIWSNVIFAYLLVA